MLCTKRPRGKCLPCIPCNQLGYAFRMIRHCASRQDMLMAKMVEARRPSTLPCRPSMEAVCIATGYASALPDKRGSGKGTIAL